MEALHQGIPILETGTTWGGTRRPEQHANAPFPWSRFRSQTRGRRYDGHRKDTGQQSSSSDTVRPVVRHEVFEVGEQGHWIT